MEYLRRVYFAGIIILFFLIMFQVPSTSVDPTGESNDASIETLKLIGLSTVFYLIGGYVALLFF